MLGRNAELAVIFFICGCNPAIFLLKIKILGPWVELRRGARFLLVGHWMSNGQIPNIIWNKWKLVKEQLQGKLINSTPDQAGRTHDQTEQAWSTCGTRKISSLLILKGTLFQDTGLANNSNTVQGNGQPSPRDASWTWCQCITGLAVYYPTYTDTKLYCLMIDSHLCTNKFLVEPQPHDHQPSMLPVGHRVTRLLLGLHFYALIPDTSMKEIIIIRVSYNRLFWY